MNLIKATDDALKYLLEGYKDDLHYYETIIEQYTRYAENAKKNIAELEAEIKERDEWTHFKSLKEVDEYLDD